MCSLSKYVVIGGFTAMAAATVAGSDLIGLLAGAVAIALTAAAGRRWPATFGGSCALPDATDVPEAGRNVRPDEAVPQQQP